MPTDKRCGRCGYYLHKAGESLLLCSNCGYVYSDVKTEQGTSYRFLGITSGNNEVREFLHLEEQK